LVGEEGRNGLVGNEFYHFLIIQTSP